MMNFAIETVELFSNIIGPFFFWGSNWLFDNLFISIKVKQFCFACSIIFYVHFVLFCQIMVPSLVHTFIENFIAMRAIVGIRENLLIPKFKFAEPIVIVFVFRNQLIDLLDELLSHIDV